MLVSVASTQGRITRRAGEEGEMSKLGQEKGSHQDLLAGGWGAGAGGGVNGNEGLGHHGEKAGSFGSSLSVRRKEGVKGAVGVSAHTTGLENN